MGLSRACRFWKEALSGATGSNWSACHTSSARAGADRCYAPSTLSYGLFFYADLSFPKGTASWLAHRIAPEDFDWSVGDEEPFFDTGFPANVVSKILASWRKRGGEGPPIVIDVSDKALRVRAYVGEDEFRELGVELLAVCAAAREHGGTGRAAFLQDVGDFGYSLKLGKRSISFDALTSRQARRALEDEAVQETVKIGLEQVPRAKKKKR
jgi:hypothetical protein